MSINWNDADIFESELLKEDKYIYLIITEDIQGMTYHNYFLQNYHNKNLITNTLFDIFYGIYLMNNRLNMMHNDNHFGNILIKSTSSKEFKTTKYQIDKIEYIRTNTNNYRLCFYDFDMSFLTGKNNPGLMDDTWLIQNKKSAKDVWTVLNSIIFCFKSIINKQKGDYLLAKIFKYPISNTSQKENENLNFLETIFTTIINNSNVYMNDLKKIFEEKKFWNAYCVDNIQEPCVIPDNPELYPLEVLRRFVNNKVMCETLGIVSADAFYKKYLKYKTKYLELKKNNIK